MAKKKRLSNKVSKKKIKILAYCDALCATGFASVSRNIFNELIKTGRYDIDVLAINYHGDPHNEKYRAWPVFNPRDPYGREKAAMMMQQMEYDILFLFQDSFILDFMSKVIPVLKNQGKKFKSIVYYPIDGTPKEEWIKNVTHADHVVTYSQFGLEKSKEAYSGCGDILVIPHGTNLNDFKKLDEETVKRFKEAYFKHNKDKFIITNLNRNQQRKDIPRTIAAFKEFRKEVPNSMLYLHMAARDQGWDLNEVVKAYGFNTHDDVLFPDRFGPNQGYPIEIVNLIYNASDLVVSTTLGEGFGLSWAEAMATKTPVLMPNNTVMPEFITEDRGYLCDSGTNNSLFTILPHDNEVIRPIVDVEDMKNKMIHIYHNYDEALEKADNAFNWISKELNWQGNVGRMWVDLFDKAALELFQLTNEPEPSASESVIESERF